jgi:SH3-like domain-containing protein
MLRQLPEQFPQGVPRLASKAAAVLSQSPSSAGGMRTVFLTFGLLAVAVSAFGFMSVGGSAQQVDQVKPGDITGSTAEAPSPVGPSGLPLPRFVSLKANKVNVRKGPSSEHSVAWVYQQKGLPVEITAESDNWRKIRDADGSEGWILQSMLAGKRTAVVADWAKERAVYLHNSATPTSGVSAKLAPGALAIVDSCDGDWCYLTATDYEGYAKQSDLWGVYPGELVD